MLSPDQIIETAYGIGERKISNTHSDKLRLVTAAIMAGTFVSLGGTLSLIGSSGFIIGAENPSLGKLIAGFLFPVGLTLVVILGAELFTGNNALLIPAFMKKKYSFKDVILNWSIVYLANFIGVVLFSYFMVYLCGLTSFDPYRANAIAITVSKTSQPLLTIFLKGIGANWCVCLAIWLSISSKGFPGKVIGCWIPVMTFAALGYEHCIANMFYLSVGLLEGAEVSIIKCVYNNLLPSTLGNIIGGALFVGTLHTWLMAKKS